MIIGNFTYNPAENTYAGEIKTLSFSRSNVLLRPVRKMFDNEPDYRVVEDGANWVIEFGAAWKRRAENGKSYLSIVLDDPALRETLNVAMFTDERHGKATLVWRRPRARDVAVEATRSRAVRAKKSTPARVTALG